MALPKLGSTSHRHRRFRAGSHAQTPYFHHCCRTRCCRNIRSLRARAGQARKDQGIHRVGGKAAFYYLPLTISEQLGYFKAEGLDVEISDFAGGARALQALWAARPMCVAAPTNTPSTCRQEPVLPGFRAAGSRAADRVGVSTKTMPNYKALADLKGKKIGVSAPGSSTNMVANLVLSRAGIKASDVSYVGVGTAAGPWPPCVRARSTP
jgi:NitT/TauT family transport system substrate-binding protein